MDTNSCSLYERVNKNNMVISKAPHTKYCSLSAYKTKIYLGCNFTKNNPSMKYYYESNESHIHPEYEHNGMYDIALVKLNNPVAINDYEVNNICLPKKWIKNFTFGYWGTNAYEYVNIGGWGGPTQLLKIAYWRIRDFKSFWDPEVTVYKLDNLGQCSVSN